MDVVIVGTIFAAVCAPAVFMLFVPRWIFNQALKQVEAEMSDASYESRRLTGTVNARRDVAVRNVDRNYWELSVPLSPLVAPMTFSRTDATDEEHPLQEWIGPLFRRRWNIESLRTTSSTLALEARDPHPFFPGVQEILNKQVEALITLAEHIELRFGTDDEHLMCPACAAPMSQEVGTLHESACDACKGRWLPADSVERLVIHELGHTPAELKELAAGTGKVERCPSCRHEMNPVLLGEVIVSLCTGCGGMWLDEGELSTLSEGRYTET